MPKQKADRVIGFRPEVARFVGSIEAALLFQQLLFWSDKGGREDGFIYKSAKDITEETYLSEKQQRLARKRLEEKGWIETKLLKANGAPTVHYRVLVEMETVVLAKGQMESAETPNPETSKRPNGNVQKAKSITEITTEITNEKTPYSEVDVALTNLLFLLVGRNFEFLRDKKPTPKDYAEMERLRRLDGRDPELIRALIYWCQQDDFWRQNIRSVAKLRAQFETLMVRAKSEIDKNRVVVI